MSEEKEETPKPAAITPLADARKKAEQEHIDMAKKMFDDDPELWRDAVIISPAAGNVTYPGHLSLHELLGAIEAAKFDILDGFDDDDDEDDENGND